MALIKGLSCAIEKGLAKKLSCAIGVQGVMSFGKHARVDKARAAIEECQKELERAEGAIAGLRAPTQYEKTREIARLIRQEMAADESSSFRGPPRARARRARRRTFPH